MKFQKLLLLAGLIASNLVAMNPANLYQQSAYLPTEKADQPIKKQIRSDIKPIETVLNPKEYDIQPWHGTTLAPMPIEKSLEKPTLEPDTQKRALYPMAPIPTVERPAIPDSRFYKDKRTSFLTPLSPEPSLPKFPTLYKEKPYKLPTSTQLEPMQKLEPRQPIVPPLPAAKALPVLAAFTQKQKHELFEVTIVNNTNDTYLIIDQNKRKEIAPGQQETITINKLEPVMQTIVRKSTSGGRHVSTQTETNLVGNIATIALIRLSDRKAFRVLVNQKAGPYHMRTMTTLQPDRSQAPTIVQKIVSHEFARAGATLYFPVLINLQGQDLQQSTIDIRPTEQAGE